MVLQKFISDVAALSAFLISFSLRRYASVWIQLFVQRVGNWPWLTLFAGAHALYGSDVRRCAIKMRVTSIHSALRHAMCIYGLKTKNSRAKRQLMDALFGAMRAADMQRAAPLLKMMRRINASMTSRTSHQGTEYIWFYIPLWCDAYFRLLLARNEPVLSR